MGCRPLITVGTAARQRSSMCVCPGGVLCVGKCVRLCGVALCAVSTMMSFSVSSSRVLHARLSLALLVLPSHVYVRRADA